MNHLELKILPNKGENDLVQLKKLALSPFRILLTDKLKISRKYSSVKIWYQMK